MSLQSVKRRIVQLANLGQVEAKEKNIESKANTIQAMPKSGAPA